MPSPQQVLIFLVSKLTLSFDSPILGVALGYAAVRTLLKLSSYSSVLPKVRIAPSVKISDLRSSLAFDQSDQSTAKLAVFRGTVEAKSALDDSKWNIFKKSDVLVSRGTIDRAVIVWRTQTCVFNEWMGLFGWWDFRAYWRALWRALTDPGSSSLQMVLKLFIFIIFCEFCCLYNSFDHIQKKKKKKKKNMKGNFESYLCRFLSFLLKAVVAEKNRFPILLL
nr:E3 ubiquitin-protein ligase SPL2-like [Malus domestica]